MYNNIAVSKSFINTFLFELRTEVSDLKIVVRGGVLHME